MNYKKILGNFTRDRVTLLISIGLILGIYRKFILSSWPAGWDTLPQIQLFFKMSELLKQGTVFGYDLEWFGGFPIFVFYGFLPYLIAALLHVLSFGLIPVLWLAKAFIIGSPIVFLLSAYSFTGVFLGKEFRFPVLIACLVYLFSPISPHSGIGLAGAVHHGLFMTLLGISLILGGLTFLEIYYQTGRRKYFLGAVALVVGIVLSHVLSSFMAAFAFSIYFIQRKRLKDMLIFGAWVFSLTIFYIYPYIAYSQFTNGEKISSNFYKADLIGALIGINWAGIRVDGLNFSNLFKNISPIDLSLFISFFFGLRELFNEKKIFLPFMFFSYLIFVSSDYLYSSFNLPLHYYRFSAFFLVISLLISARGLGSILKSIENGKMISRELAQVFLVILILPVVIGFKSTGERVDWETAYSNEKNLIDTISELKPTGRVFVERAEDESNPHLFSVYFPMLRHIPVLFGLLIESSDNSRYIVPPIQSISANQAWGKSAYYMNQFSYEQILRKIADLGVEYFCLHKSDSVTMMETYIRVNKSPQVALEAKKGPYAIFKFKDPLPFISSLQHAPILCYNENPALSDEKLLKNIFDSSLSPDIKFVIINKKEGIPPAEILNKFGALIIVGAGVSDQAMEMARSFKGGDIYFLLKSSPDTFSELKEKVRPGGKGVYPFTFKQFSDFVPFFQEKIVIGKATAISPSLFSNSKIAFNAQGPVVVNIGYFPYWQSKQSPVFRLSPSKFLVFANGETALEFKVPLAQKVLMGFSFLAFLAFIFKFDVKSMIVQK